MEEVRKMGLDPKIIPLPPKDRPIMLAAIAVRATHPLTGDFRHFGKHYGKVVEGVIITAPGDYLA